eukprot:3946900-Pleurochrysis_carterae.AAC.2
MTRVLKSSVQRMQSACRTNLACMAGMAAKRRMACNVPMSSSGTLRALRTAAGTPTSRKGRRIAQSASSAAMAMHTRSRLRSCRDSGHAKITRSVLRLWSSRPWLASFSAERERLGVPR